MGKRRKGKLKVFFIRISVLSDLEEEEDRFMDTRKREGNGERKEKSWKRVAIHQKKNFKSKIIRNQYLCKPFPTFRGDGLVFFRFISTSVCWMKPLHSRYITRLSGEGGKLRKLTDREDREI